MKTITKIEPTRTRVLVVCPLRVGSVWKQEIEHWEHLHNLRISVAIGTAAERVAALNADADIYVINRENLQWLIEKSGTYFEYDMVVLDELSSFMNWQSKRFKAFKMAKVKDEGAVVERSAAAFSVEERRWTDAEET